MREAIGERFDDVEIDRSAWGAASFYDSWARRQAYIEGKSVNDIYGLYTIEYKNGDWNIIGREAAREGLFHAAEGVEGKNLT